MNSMINLSMRINYSKTLIMTYLILINISLMLKPSLESPGFKYQNLLMNASINHNALKMQLFLFPII